MYVQVHGRLVDEKLEELVEANLEVGVEINQKENRG